MHGRHRAAQSTLVAVLLVLARGATRLARSVLVTHHIRWSLPTSALRQRKHTYAQVWQARHGYGLGTAAWTGTQLA